MFLYSSANTYPCLLHAEIQLFAPWDAPVYEVVIGHLVKWNG